MLIKDILTIDLSEDIKNVIDLEDISEAAIQSEIENYIITDGLADEYSSFASIFTSNILETGVWLSGFYGSGKSYFGKLLGYLISNRTINGTPARDWISDGFRQKFTGKDLKEYANVNKGIDTANNNRYLRFFWEISDTTNWTNYAKGGPYNKWYGNLWLKLFWKNNGEDLKKDKGANLRNKENFFKEGITYSGSGSKGASFRYLPSNFICDNGGSSITPLDHYKNALYLLAFANSKLIFYIIDCLNPTVNIQIGDLERIPFILPAKDLEITISNLASSNVEIKKQICSFRITESNYDKNLLLAYPDPILKERILKYLNFENAQLTLVLLNEAVINQLILEVYELNEHDKNQVEVKIGKPVGLFPVLEEAKNAYLAEAIVVQDIVKEHIFKLPVTIFDNQQFQNLTAEFSSLYQSNNDFEEFCIRHQVNPINVWFWFRESKILPAARAVEIGLEFLADAFRSILKEDEDGIVPLVGLPGEPGLIDRLEQYCFKQGFTTAQFMQLDGIIGRQLNEYIEQHFFKNFSDHLNLFMYLPKTPFIWHLTSGVNQGFEAYIIIYKWNSDSLYRLKSSYLSKRVESLNYRLQQIGDSNTAQAQTEKEIIRRQLQEIDDFSGKIDQLIAEGYDPKLDDGVGKNIAPLQNKGMLKAEVLNKKQLEKYLNADW